MQELAFVNNIQSNIIFPNQVSRMPNEIKRVGIESAQPASQNGIASEKGLAGTKIA